VITREVVVRSARDVERLQARLAKPEVLLKRISRVVVASAKAAFVDQKLGEKVWAERYPVQEEPWINIAGAVSDWTKGGKVKERRFDKRPAVIDTRLLQRSMAAQGAVKVNETSVEVGTVVSYAKHHQFGIPSKQPITETTRQGLTAFLKTARGKPFRAKLGFIYQDQELTTNVGERPFLGLTDQSRKDLLELCATHVAGPPEDGGP